MYTEKICPHNDGFIHVKLDTLTLQYSGVNLKSDNWKAVLVLRLSQLVYSYIGCKWQLGGAKRGGRGALSPRPQLLEGPIIICDCILENRPFTHKN